MSPESSSTTVAKPDILFPSAFDELGYDRK
jgi:hypothetical protein